MDIKHIVKSTPEECAELWEIAFKAGKVVENPAYGDAEKEQMLEQAKEGFKVWVDAYITKAFNIGHGMGSAGAESMDVNKY